MKRRFILSGIDSRAEHWRWIFYYRRRPIAGAAIFDLLHPNRPFKLEFLGQLSGDDFINPSTGHWPAAVLRIFHLAVSDGLLGAVYFFWAFCNHLPGLSFSMGALWSPSFDQRCHS
jgi:hypothetical protein